ncbi:anti-sigma regulatory factor [Pedosphaera parvula]|nr:anti-sigma regulatory factor [Pedosphaera parvula]
MASAARVEITTSLDIVNARQKSRALAQELGFAGSEITLITAAVSEVARNILEYARQGELVFERLESGAKKGLKIVARDQGPGIPDIEQAMQYGYSTRDGGAGVGLPGARWLMDEFAIKSTVGKGTVITMKKWANQLGYQTNQRNFRD